MTRPRSCRGSDGRDRRSVEPRSTGWRGVVGKTMVTASLVAAVCGVASGVAGGGSVATTAELDSGAYLPIAARQVELHRLPGPPTAPPPTATVVSTSPTAPEATATLTVTVAAATVGTPTVTPGAVTTAEPTALPADCGSVPSFADGLEPVVERHVATWGNDEQGDGSPANPYATIARAARIAQPGTAIRVHAGLSRWGVHRAARWHG